MPKAICIACGHIKSAPWKRCSHCNYVPLNDELAMLKSVYLSIGRFEQAEDKERYERELMELGCMIKEGKPIPFEPAELERLRAQKHLMESVPTRAVLGAVVRLFLPGLIFLAILLIIWFVLRLVRNPGSGL